MKYITYKRFRHRAICGDVNIPADTECIEKDGMIYCNCKPICKSASSNAHAYFTQNEDGKGLERGKLLQAITKALTQPSLPSGWKWQSAGYSPFGTEALIDEKTGKEVGEQAYKKWCSKNEKERAKIQARWEKVWADSVCLPYKRSDHIDHWLWNHDFYNADISDLEHIANLIGVGGKSKC